jgi:AcrR family transcriptional regulator
VLYKREMASKTAHGQATRQNILAAAVRIGSVDGLSGLTLGRLAGELAMSKSGLFAHFGSKEELQLATIEHARQLYVEQVIIPGLAHPQGIASLFGLCHEYVALMERGVFPGGCFFASAMAEFDARPGPVRDRVAEVQRMWLDLLDRAGRDALQGGELRPSTDPDQLAFELEAAMLSSNWYYHLYSDPRFFRQARRAVQTSLESQATAKGRSALDAVLAALPKSKVKSRTPGTFSSATITVSGGSSGEHGA